MSEPDPTTYLPRIVVTLVRLLQARKQPKLVALLGIAACEVASYDGDTYGPAPAYTLDVMLPAASYGLLNSNMISTAERTLREVLGEVTKTLPFYFAEVRVAPQLEEVPGPEWGKEIRGWLESAASSTEPTAPSDDEIPF